MCLFPSWQESYDKPSVLKSKGVTLLTKVHIVRLWSFLWSCTVVRAGPERRQSAEELMPLNCGA